MSDDQNNQNAMNDQKPIGQTGASFAPSTLLEAAVRNYEKGSGLMAVNYRAVAKRGTLEEKIDAAKQDLRWWENYSHEVRRELSRIVNQVA